MDVGVFVDSVHGGCPMVEVATGNRLAPRSAFCTQLRLGHADCIIKPLILYRLNPLIPDSLISYNMILVNG